MQGNQGGESSLPRLRTGPMKLVGQGGERKEGGWNARQWLKEKTSGGGPRKSGGEGGKTASLITVQAGICALVIVTVLVLKAINIPQTVEVLNGLDSALTSESDIDRALGRIRFVGDFFSESKPVFNPETQGFVAPIQDMAVETAGGTQTVVSFDVTDDITPVLAAADGQIFYAGASGDYGTLVIIRHQEGYETWYGGLTPEVKVGHTVVAGERIGTISGATLKFLAYRDGVAMDPRPYLKSSGE